MICSEMSSEIAAVLEPDDSDAQAWDAAGDGCAAPSAERRLRMLDRLAEAGLEIALAIERRVKAAEPSHPLAELNAAAMAYARAARGVRLAILLQDQLTQEAGDPDEVARQAEAAEAQAQAAHKTAHIGRAVRIIERVATDHCGKRADKAAAYAYAARERLDDDDIYGLVATRPVGELVALICRDLGLQPDWDALAEEAWAQAEIASEAEGSPFLEDDDSDEDEAAEDAAGPDAARPAWSPPTFQERLRAVAQDPAIIVAARRDSG
jgi:hypothetical protein